ncbi:hypothetical protein [Actinokineospora spheciospongiae]|uniref:hypothetical protein n=1 Tax=Actinokineospora spheciospongiae TaxID=909613 RepID=UPI000D70AD5F|nr:hypothetical protein [Actinokineospora spheciospongiae]PWW61769.1 hypothetical protein DFQ13_10615 [Actinokineospora spheciospongiae]
MSALVLACGNATTTARPDALTVRHGLDLVELPERPGRGALDPVLKSFSGDRLVVHGTDADLAAVVLRLMRTDRLGAVAVGYLPVDPDGSRVVPLWGLPRDRERLAAAAVSGEVDPFPLIRDDAGGVLVGGGVVDQPQGVAYCDDETALRGRAKRIEVAPDPDGGPGLVARVTRGGLFAKKVSTHHGRAFQIGCLRTRFERDGVPTDAAKWTWYRHTEDLRVARGLL